MSKLSKPLRREKRTRHTFHPQCGSRHSSGSGKLYTFIPAKTRKGRSTYKEVLALDYYRDSPSEEEDTPVRKKTKTPGGTGRKRNLGDEHAPFAVEDLGEYQEVVTAPKQKTKVRALPFVFMHVSY